MTNHLELEAQEIFRAQTRSMILCILRMDGPQTLRSLRSILDGLNFHYENQFYDAILDLEAERKIRWADAEYQQIATA
jgi:hypothetical protein